MEGDAPMRRGWWVIGSLGLLLSACSAPQSSREASGVGAVREDDATASLPATGSADGVPECTARQLLARVPEPETIASHRTFALPTLHYPFGSRRKAWGMELLVRVGEDGGIECYSVRDPYGRPQPLDDGRRALLAQLRRWRYMPFLRDDQPVAALVTEHVAEEERPERQVALPEVPLQDVRIVLKRTGCFGTCPSYRVEVRGDGQVTYEGQGFVDVEGRHVFHVPPADVAALVESARGKDLWSLRPRYFYPITDNPSYSITLDMGGQVHGIDDYVGEEVGMPHAVSEFEGDVDRLSRALNWVHLGTDAVSALEDEGFDFDSPAGASLLARAAADEKSEDAALLRLLALGTPITGGKMAGRLGWSAGDRPLVEVALRSGHSALYAPLVALGALSTRGRADPAKRDAAFGAAIAAGRMHAVQAVWNLPADSHPSLFYRDPGDDEHPARIVPVTLLLSEYGAKPWQGRQIARWLLERGCDPAAAGADGRTLLHIAASAGDVGLVRDLLALGVDPSASGAYGSPPLGGADNEDVAMALLEAGSEVRSLSEPGHTFRAYAVEQHWARVVAWLDTHPAH